MKEDRKYYTCRYDAAFKEFFLTEDTSLLQIFLENVLKIKINHLDIKNSELINDNVHVRRKLVDCIAYADEGVFNIEVNTSLDSSVIVRNTCFLMNAYSRFFSRGENYNSSRKFIQLNLNYGRANDPLFNQYCLLDYSGNFLVDNFLIYHFNMDKYMEFWYNNDKEEIEKNKYLIMLDLPKEDLASLSKKDKVVSNYMERLNYVNDESWFQSYMSAEEDNRKMLNTYKEQVEIAQSKLDEAEAKAEKAYDLGVEQTKVDSCISLYKNGVDIEVISKSLSLPIEKVKNILSLD